MREVTCSDAMADSDRRLNDRHVADPDRAPGDRLLGCGIQQLTYRHLKKKRVSGGGQEWGEEREAITCFSQGFDSMVSVQAFDQRPQFYSPQQQNRT